jgi:hypothetical protein
MPSLVGTSCLMRQGDPIPERNPRGRDYPANAQLNDGPSAETVWSQPEWIICASRAAKSVDSRHAQNRRSVRTEPKGCAEVVAFR